MKSGVYVIYDEVAELFTAPLSLKNDAVAERYFGEKMLRVNDPTDYKLYKIGEYDDETGFLLCVPDKILLKTGSKIEKVDIVGD